MKGSRITAVGLVVAAGALDRVRAFPAARVGGKPRRRSHRRGRGEEAVPRRRGRDPCGAAQPQARAVRPHRGRQARRRHSRAHRRRLTEAPGPAWLTGSRGDIIAVLSDEAREAQVAQAQSLVTQRRTELEAKRNADRSAAPCRGSKLRRTSKRSSRPPKPTLALALAERERGVVRAPWAGVIVDVAVEVGQAVVLVRGPRDRVARGARSDAGGGRGIRTQARRHQGRRDREGAAGHR